MKCEVSYSCLCISTPAITTSRVSLLSSMRLINSLSFGLRGLASCIIYQLQNLEFDLSELTIPNRAEMLVALFLVS